MSLRVALLAVVLVALLPAGGSAQLPGGGDACTGELDASAVPQKPGPRVRYGVVPGVEAGQSGAAPAQAKPEDRAKTIRALELLRPRTGVLTVRLNRLFWSDGDAGIARFERLVKRYARRGYQIEVQLRYHPSAEQEGDIEAWTRYVREVVDRLGRYRAVRSLQVTNEVTVTFSADSSDGAYAGARDALIQGVIAAHDEKQARGYGQLGIGFNWFYRLDPSTDSSFWGYLRDHGGAPFVRSLDWIGLDAYPGTFFPPAEQPGQERDGMVNAFSSLRCFAAIPGIPATVPIHVNENGWPTTPARSADRQATAAAAMLSAVNDFRGTYNVTDYRWHNLRDADSSDPRQEQQYGLMRDDYTPKPAFDVVCRFYAAHSARSGGTACDARGPTLRLRVRCRRARLRGADVGAVARVAFRSRGRRLRVDRRAPFTARLRRRGRVTARVTLRSGRELRRTRRARACQRSSR
ncbi:MAG: hypothetical protein QOG63_678 [Thermoleophilaceae bacterium]|nr:hypothetical protein [Thermoleophilaceae bacterium]